MPPPIPPFAKAMMEKIMAEGPKIPKPMDHTPAIIKPPPDIPPREIKPIYIHKVPGTDVLTSYNLNLPGYENFTLPPSEELTEVSHEEWQDFMQNSRKRTVVDGKLVPYERPAPKLTPAAQMYKAFTTGVIVTAANTRLNGTYPTNSHNWAAMTTELYIEQETITWTDTAGMMHEFSRPEFSRFVAAVAQWRSDWRKYAEGHAASPPAETIALP